ncbi:MAG: hypothetical protein PHZ00_03015 [Candidatus Peribacteraceae bacterium]|nr:hypothetical protein [Candidatus Peribacteraceae bacterium]
MSSSSPSSGAGLSFKSAVKTLSNLAKPEGAEEHTSIVDDVSDTVKKTWTALWSLFSTAAFSPLKLPVGAITASNRVLVGGTYRAIDKTMQVSANTIGQLQRLIGGGAQPAVAH